MFADKVDPNQYEGSIEDIVELAREELNSEKPRYPTITQVPEDYIFSKYPIVEIHAKPSQSYNAEKLREATWVALRAIASDF